MGFSLYGNLSKKASVPGEKMHSTTEKNCQRLSAWSLLALLVSTFLWALYCPICQSFGRIHATKDQ